MATPAIVDGALYVRTLTHLYAFGEGAKASRQGTLCEKVQLVGPEPSPAVTVTASSARVLSLLGSPRTRGSTSI